MNPNAEELMQNAQQFRAWAEAGGVHFTPSMLDVYAGAMAEAARELMLLHWRVVGGPPKREPVKVEVPPAILRQRLTVYEGGGRA